MIISLHFLGLSSIPLFEANWEISFTTMGMGTPRDDFKGRRIINEFNNTTVPIV
jgi:hypothetical protein